MFLQCESQDLSSTELEEFTKWILHVGDGKIGEDSDSYASINIPQEYKNLITQLKLLSKPPILILFKNTKMRSF